MVSMNRYVPKLGVRGSSPLGIANLFAYNVVARVHSILNKRSNGPPAPEPTTTLDLPSNKDRVQHSALARFFPTDRSERSQNHHNLAPYRFDGRAIRKPPIGKNERVAH